MKHAVDEQPVPTSNLFDTPTGDPLPADVRTSRRTYTLVLLTLAMTVSLMDRYVLSMLIQPMKHELGLSDTAIGLLTGLAFSTFFALFALLIARFSDRGRTRTVIIVSLITWSALTALCGLVQNFLQLLLVRFGVGAGEAGIGPASHAVIAELYSPDRRSAALAVFTAASPAGIMLAFALSGPLETAFGWRWTFVLMGIPGIVLAIVFAFTAPALRRSSADSTGGTQRRRDLHYLLRNSLFVQLTLMIAMIGVLGYGAVQWLPAYFERTFAVARSTLGPVLALSQGLGMLGGSLAGGFVTHRLIQSDARWQIRIIGLSAALALPFAVGIYFSTEFVAAVACVGLSAFLLSLPNGALWAAVQDATPPSARATGAAAAMMVGSFIGLGCGPLVIGLISDALHRSYPNESLRLAMLSTTVLAGTLVFLHFAMVVRARDRILRDRASAAAA